MDDGAFIKEYETQRKETEQAVQLAVTSVASEDPRYVERVPPPLSEEFPIGAKVFFLGEHAYGTAAQVSGATETSLSVILAVGAFMCLSHRLVAFVRHSTLRRTRTKTNGSRRSSGTKLARGITLPTRLPRWLDSLGKRSRNSLPGSWRWTTVQQR